MELKKDWYLFERITKIDVAGYVNEVSKHPDRKGAPYWIFVAVNRGKRTLYANGSPRNIGAYHFFLLPPYTVQRPLDFDDHSAFYFHFYAQAKRIDQPTRISPERTILPTYGSLPTKYDCFPHMRFLCEHTVSPYANNAFLTSQLEAMLSIIGLQCRICPSPKKMTGITAEQIMEFIIQNIGNKLHSEDYEATFSRSYHQLNHIFKKSFEKTIKQYHMELQMERAAQLLIEGKSIGETARSCGFEDYYYFINSFTKIYGNSPSNFCKLHGG